MKSQTSKQVTEKKPHAPLANQSEEAASPSKSARQARPSFDDLHARTRHGPMSCMSSRAPERAVGWRIGLTRNGKS